MKKVHTDKFHQVDTSADGERWVRQVNQYDDTPEGLQQALKHAKGITNMPYVRVVHVTRTRRVKHVRQNTNVLTAQQIKDLLTRGQEACKGIPGIMVNEGFLIGFGGPEGMTHGPTRVSVAFHAPTVLGKCPRKTESIDAWRKWNEDAKAQQAKSLAAACDALKAAGIWFTANNHEIVLRPSR